MKHFEARPIRCYFLILVKCIKPFQGCQTLFFNLCYFFSPLPSHSTKPQTNKDITNIDTQKPNISKPPFCCYFCFVVPYTLKYTHIKNYYKSFFLFWIKSFLAFFLRLLIVETFTNWIIKTDKNPIAARL